MIARRDRVRALVLDHRSVAVLLGVAGLVHAATLITYRSGLFFADSWEYVLLAWHHFPVDIAPDRPSGYGLALRLLAPGHNLLPVLVAQHLAVLATAVLAYFLILAGRGPRALALVVAAVIAFDGYALALAQHVLPEALFSLCVLGALGLAATRRGTVPALLGGLLLAAAVLLRTAGLFAVPVWLAYLMWRRDLRAVAIATAALALPLAVSAAGVGLKYHRAPTLTAAGGWFLYGRVGPIASCPAITVPARLRYLCTDGVQRPDRWADFYIFDPASPINRRWRSTGPFFADPADLRASTADASTFARAVVVQRPRGYAGLVAGDLLRYATPGAASHAPTSDTAIHLPPRPAAPPTGDLLVTQQTYLPGYRPRAGPLAGMLDRYVRIVHLPRPLVAAGVLALLAALALALVRRRCVVPPEAWCYGAAGLALLAGSAATAEFTVRYLIPAAAPLLVGGTLAVAGLRKPPPDTATA